MPSLCSYVAWACIARDKTPPPVSCALKTYCLALLLRIQASRQDQLRRSSYLSLPTGWADSIPSAARCISFIITAKLYTDDVETSPADHDNVPQEPECHATLASLFSAAAEPHRVFAGVCEQRLLPAGSSEDCLPEQLPAELRSHVSCSVLFLGLNTLGSC